MSMLNFPSVLNMSSLTCNFILYLLTVGCIQQIFSQCPSPFVTDNGINLCYYYKRTALSWSNALNQCFSKTINGSLIEIHTKKDFDNLKNVKISGTDVYWIGANNFAFFRDSHWRWLDGSVVDDSVMPWCSYSTYEVAIGAYCAAYDINSQCVTNYLCNVSLSAPCVMAKRESIEGKSILSNRASASSSCANSYGGAYANWWTYSLLLLNWFMLFCFILYLSNHLNINKRTVILIISIVILSFMIIIAFAILWGVQYQDILQIPLIIVILGSIAGIFYLIDILILVADRVRVRKWLACMIITVIVLIFECLLMLGLILCIAHCSGYISLSWTNLDKDIIAALLSGLIAAISVVLIHTLLFLIGDVAQERANMVPVSNKTTPNNAPTATTRQTLVPRPTSNVNGANPFLATKRYDKVERATSPVDERIINEFYTDHPNDIHQYQLDGRQYVVYEGIYLMNIDTYRKELTQAMLLQEPQGLREAIAHAKNSVHVTALADEIHQAESLENRLK